MGGKKLVNQVLGGTCCIVMLFWNRLVGMFWWTGACVNTRWNDLDVVQYLWCG